MSIASINSEALGLPLRERILLAESLWESIGDPFEESPAMSDEDALQLAIKRDQDIESGEVEPLTHDDMMRRLRQ
jgi:putative addiction module component (TIGR02574 family)